MIPFKEENADMSDPIVNAETHVIANLGVTAVPVIADANKLSTKIETS